MKIAVVTHLYPIVKGMAERLKVGLFVEDHEERLHETLGADVKVFNYDLHKYSPMVRSIKSPGHWWPLLRHMCRVRRNMAGDIREWAGSDELSQVIVHWWIPYGPIAAKRFDNVHVICHGTDLFLLQKYPFLARLLAGRARRVESWQCVSQALKKILLGLYPFIDPDSVLVEPMPVDHLFANKNGPREDNLILSVGHLVKRKNFDRLIREVAKLPGLKLEIYGEGVEQHALEALISELGLTDRVKLCGMAPREDLAEAYNRARLFVLLSVDEGFGLVLKEAQACGCKTMAYIGDGMVDTGLDYPLEPGEPIAERIKQALAELSGQ